MDESLNTSLSIKRVSIQIKEVKIRYMKLIIFLLIINSISFTIQKYPELTNNIDNKVLITKNIFIFFEDIGLKIIIIYSLIKFKINIIILCSLLYFIIGIIITFYLVFNRLVDKISEEQKINDVSIIFCIFNIALYFAEGVLLVICSQLMSKEKTEKNKEKFGYKTGDDIIRSKNLLGESVII